MRPNAVDRHPAGSILSSTQPISFHNDEAEAEELFVPPTQIPIQTMKSREAKVFNESNADLSRVEVQPPASHAKTNLENQSFIPAAKSALETSTVS